MQSNFHGNSMSKLLTNEADQNLQQVLVLMNELSQWLIRSGVGYTSLLLH